MRRPLALAAALSVAGCAVGPDYHEPELQTASSYEGVSLRAQDAPISVPLPTEADLSHWWTTLDDQQLHGLIDRALKTNLDLRIAASRVREARQQEIISGAAGLPQFNLSGAGVKLHSNSNIAAGIGGASPAAAAASSVAAASAASAAASSNTTPTSTNVTLYSAGFDASWEIDVFGGVRRSVEAARAGTQAAQWQARDAQVTLTAEIAADYLGLRATQARLAILRGEAKSQTDTLQIISARRQAGFVTELDVNQQQTLLASTTAQIPLLVAQIRVMEHAIAILMAEQPESLASELDPVRPLPPVPPQLPVGLPSDLLRRRPDVRAAERQLAAATAQEGVAIADLYPKFNLLGALSYSGNALGTLFSAGNFGQIGLASIMWPIFKGGQIRANIKAKQEEEQQAYLSYQKTILGAVKDVEDALVRYVTEQQRLQSLEKAVAFGRSSLAIAIQQYQGGLVTYVDVLSAQSNYLSAQDQLAQSHQALATDLVSLYKALGGGWT
ncbi:efflux transporter, outer membrane factor (OMF) lipoprotein, NodT family [Enhydrobacter aerosaccus]|uniref:Efflux transporter, outer membrane factor (OMF) lipoprotein, NodT family n=1 Tax=Enhydrobacter aerosaccus TaxID=225324 RepID=A0A1T4NWH0_9HYPH|nr:efflux transporter outer membrane subunit [Enhydrobacter aerosaccus]SJZ83392.1 efflux transporter, outer membrane factor (OMF) lipoprotein, NodT family [Enhydrobacter aerosaccus]